MSYCLMLGWLLRRLTPRVRQIRAHQVEQRRESQGLGGLVLSGTSDRNLDCNVQLTLMGE